jgi:hypothetical protein
MQQIHHPNSSQHIKVKEPNKNISLDLTNLIADELLSKTFISY